MPESTPASATRSVHDRLVALLTGPLADAHLELVDVVATGLGTPQASVQVFVDHGPDHPLGGRIDLDGVSAATRVIDAAIEAGDPVEGAYTLEVSSPGLERALRTPAHFTRFLGTVISVKTVAGSGGERRIEGRLDAADNDPTGGISVEGVAIPYAAIERARTVFIWGPQPKPGSGPGKSAAKRAAKTPRVGAALDPAPVPTGYGSNGSEPRGDEPGAVPDKQTTVSADVDHEEE